MIKIGQKIPDFELEIFDQNGMKKARISDFKGRWIILIFYPKDLSNCIPELENVMRRYKSLHSKVKIVVVSIKSGADFKRLCGKNAQLMKSVAFLPDLTGRLCTFFETYIESERSFMHSSFLVDPHGIVKAIDMHDGLSGRPFLSLMDELGTVGLDSPIDCQKDVAPAYS